MVISWPSLHYVSIIATSHDGAIIIRYTMEERKQLGLPWYGLRLLSKCHIQVIGCEVRTIAYNADADIAGLDMNRSLIKELLVTNFGGTIPVKLYPAKPAQKVDDENRRTL